jgi:hypothetical protein
VERLRALGNSLVPQIAEVIGRAIMEIDDPGGEGMSDNWDDATDAMAGEIADLKLEIERLRAALQEIANEAPNDFVATVLQIARRALEGKE